MLLSLTQFSSPSTSRLFTIPTEGQLFLGMGLDWNTNISPLSNETVEVYGVAENGRIFFSSFYFS
jgi:hypothetical protein